MKITLVSQWFPPEQAPIGYMIKELADALSDEGHDVTIITGFPNHPTGVVFSGYKKKWILKESIYNYKVTRVWLATSSRRSPLSRVITFLTFTFTSTLALLLQPRPQLIFAVFQPISVGLTLPILARVKNAKLILNVQDLHPNVQIELGMIRNPLIIKLLKKIEYFGYKHASALTVICDAFRDHCIEHGAKSENVEIIPNWIDVDEIQPGERDNLFRRGLGLDGSHFIVLYAGTIGLVSGASVMVGAAQQLTDLPHVRIVFVGEGPLVSILKQEVELLGLSNVIFAPFQPREMLSTVQAIADVSVVSLKRGKGNASVPSKVLGYMAAARPVIASVDANSETAHTVLMSKCGLVTDSDNHSALAGAIRYLSSNKELRMSLGLNGRDYLEKNYTKQIVTSKFINFFKQVAK